ncbi:hypothetical protein ACW185_01775 [Limosilactobacillus fermentum]
MLPHNTFKRYGEGVTFCRCNSRPHVGRALQGTWQARLLVNDRLTATATITLMNVPAPTNNHKH